MARGKDSSGRPFFYLRVLLLFGGEMETERKRFFLCVAFFRTVPTKAVVGTDGSFQAGG